MMIKTANATIHIDVESSDGVIVYDAVDSQHGEAELVGTSTVNLRLDDGQLVRGLTADIVDDEDGVRVVSLSLTSRPERSCAACDALPAVKIPDDAEPPAFGDILHLPFGCVWPYT